MINTIFLIILSIICFFLAPFMTIGVILMVSNLHILVNILGLIFFMIGFMRIIFRMFK